MHCWSADSLTQGRHISTEFHEIAMCRVPKQTLRSEQLCLDVSLSHISAVLAILRSGLIKFRASSSRTGSCRKPQAVHDWHHWSITQGYDGDISRL